MAKDRNWQTAVTIVFVVYSIFYFSFQLQTEIE